MPLLRSLKIAPLAGLAAVALTIGWRAQAQAPTPAPAINDLPNPYQTIEGHFKLPEGRTWGSTSAVDVDRDGRSIWVAERCGANTCFDRATGRMSPLNPILKFDESGRLVRSFGAGMLVFPHGIHVDRDGNVWVTDGQDNQSQPAGRGRGAGANAPTPPPAEKPVGHQVFKFSPEGKLLMTFGKAGVRGNPPDALTEPNDVIVAPNGDVFIAEGHGGQNLKAPPDTVARISKFTRDGKFIASWGKLGGAPGEFRTPHGLAFDSKGRLFVADRGNLRIQVFDQSGKFLEESMAFSRLSGIAIDRNDVVYGADSESSDTSNKGWKRGIRIGPASGLKPQYFIPDPQMKPTGTSAAEGVAVDAQGSVYGAEVGPRAVKKYVKSRSR
jgi:sugar lactone lactonase YvrE